MPAWGATERRNPATVAPWRGFARTFARGYSKRKASLEGDESRSVGDRAPPAATAAGRSRRAGEQDGAHRLGGDAAPEGIPGPGCGGLVRLGRRWSLRESNDA